MASEVVEIYEAGMGRKKAGVGVKCRVGSGGQRGILGYRSGRKLVGGLGEALCLGLCVCMV